MLRQRTLNLSCLIALCLLGSISPAQALWPFDFNFFVERCLTDDETPSSDRQPYEKVALDFVYAIGASKFDDAFSEFSEAASASLGSDKFTSAFGRASPLIASSTDIHVAHSYRLKLTTTGSATQLARCSMIARGSSKQPEDVVFVVERPVPDQVHLIVEGKSTDFDWNFIFWMVPEGETWRVLNVHFAIVAIAGKSALDLWRLSNIQRVEGDELIAYVLRGAALQAADRGPDFHLGILSGIEKQVKEARQPPELTGDSPYIWTFKGRPYRVRGLSVQGDVKKLALRIYREVAWTDEKQINEEGRLFASEFAKAHAGYAEVFDEIVVTAQDQDGQRYVNTVVTKDDAVKPALQ